MQLHPVFILIRKSDDIQLGITVDPEIIPIPEMQFRPAIAGSKLITLNQPQINHAFLITEVIRPLNIYITLNITHAGVVVIIIIRPGKNSTQRKANH
jgi:hypothetical protein